MWKQTKNSGSEYAYKWFILPSRWRHKMKETTWWNPTQNVQLSRKGSPGNTEQAQLSPDLPVRETLCRAQRTVQSWSSFIKKSTEWPWSHGASALTLSLISHLASKYKQWRFSFSPHNFLTEMFRLLMAIILNFWRLGCHLKMCFRGKKKKKIRCY